MATAAQVNQIRQGYDDIAMMLERDMRRIWPQLRTAAPATIRDTLLDLAPQLADRYGAMSATMGAEWFEATTGRPAQLAPLTAPAAVQASVRYGAGGFWTVQREAAFEAIRTYTVRHSLQPGRSTVAVSAGRNRMRYARAPEAGACAWCLMLASRGAVYYSSKSAGDTGRGVGDDFHDDCNCVIEAAEDDSELSYDSRALYEEYKNVQRSGMSDAEVAAAMREAYGLA